MSEYAPIIAVDFDGTLCENKWPEIGAPRATVIEELLNRQRNGARAILWTCRGGEHLTQAVDWCAEHGIHFDAVNENLPELMAQFDNDSRKIFANEYWDDKAVRVENGVIQKI